MGQSRCKHNIIAMISMLLLDNSSTFYISYLQSIINSIKIDVTDARCPIVEIARANSY
jgi:hypothetical protein